MAAAEYAGSAAVFEWLPLRHGDPMKEKKSDGKEKQGRLQSILRGAFAGPPTPLKDIPTKEGESRKLKRKKAKKRT